MTLPDWYREFVAAVVARLPNEIDEATARQWIDDPDGLEQALGSLAAASTTIGGTLKNDKTNDGWELLVDATEPTEISGDALTIHEFDGNIFGEEVVERVAQLEGLLGQRHLEYLLDHQDEIPEHFRPFSLVFAGTRWMGTDGNNQVPCVSWRQGAWELTFGILEGGLDDRDRLVRAGL